MRTTNINLPIGFSTSSSRVLVDRESNPILTLEQRDDLVTNKQIVHMAISGLFKAADILKIDPLNVARLIADGSFLAMLVQVSVGAVPTMADMMKQLASAFPGKKIEDLTEAELTSTLSKKV